MCGICGAVATDGELNPAIRAAIGPMTATLRHRGPDGLFCFDDVAAALGHARLAIIDRAGGDQPIPNERSLSATKADVALSSNAVSGCA